MATLDQYRNILFFYFFLNVLFFNIEKISAQSGYLPREDFSGASYVLAVHEVNFEGVDSKSSARLPYDRVKGSPYHVHEFIEAKFYKSLQGKFIGSVKSRLNLATHEIHFIGENGQEYIAPAELAGVVEFENREKFIRNIPGLILNNKPLLGYAQELVGGEVAFLKYIKRYVASADSMFGTLKRYYFANTNYYFIKTASSVLHVKKLTEEAILALLPPSDEMNLWIRKNDLNFKREEDWVSYVEEWNRLKSLSTK